MSAYYFHNQISLHAMYLWTKEKKQPIASLSNCTDHKAPAVVTSLKEILRNLTAQGKTKINIISDSLLSQYQNKKIFWLMLQFSEEFNCQIKWIYLESRHGKGIPDGIGAVVKCVILNLIAYNPTLPIYTVKGLTTVGLQGHLLSVELYQYSSEDVAVLNHKIPSLFAVPGTT